MSTALATQESMAVQPATDLLSVIAMAVQNPAVDVAKMQALLDMKLRVDARDAEVEFNAALARLMPKLPRIQKDGAIFNKDGKSIRSRYAYYEDIDAAIRPLLSEEGFSFSFDTDDSVAGSLRVIGTLAHKMGFSRKSSLTVPTSNPVITGGQAVGAANSFAKRYIVVNMLNIVTVGQDNDMQGEKKKISDEQVLQLEMKISDMSADKQRFLEWAGYSQLADVLEEDFQKLLRALEAKGRKA